MAHPICESCGIYRGCKTPFTFGVGTLSPKVVIVSDYPSAYEDNSGQMFESREWQIVAQELGVHVKDARYMYLVRCTPYNDKIERQPSIHETELCMNWFRKAMLSFDPSQTIVITLGKIAYQSVTGDTTKFSDVVGRPRELNIHDRKFRLVPNYHPSSIIKDVGLSSEFKQIFNSIFNSNKPKPTGNNWVITDYDQSMEVIQTTMDLYNKKEIEWTVFDTETSSLMPWEGTDIMFSIAHNKANVGYALPLMVNNEFIVANTAAMSAYEIPRELLIEHEAIAKELTKLRKDFKLVKDHVLDPTLAKNRRSEIRALIDEYMIKQIALSARGEALLEAHTNDVREANTIPFDITPTQKANIKRSMRALLEQVPLVGHNLKFDIRFACVANDVNLSKVRIYNDTIVLGHQCFGRSGFGLSLKKLANALLGIGDKWEGPMDAYLSAFKLISERTYDRVPTRILGEYAAKDALYDRDIHNFLVPMIQADMDPIRKIITQATIPFTEAEVKGIAIDRKMKDFLDQEYSKVLADERAKMLSFPVVQKYTLPTVVELREANPRKRKPFTEAEIQEKAFNPGSHSSMREIVYGSGYYNLPVNNDFLTDKGAPQTSAEALLSLVEDGHAQGEAKEFLSSLSTYATINKLHTSYIQNLDKHVFDELYKPEYKMTGTVSGRFSSSFHTLPSRSDIKRIFISRWRSQGGLFLAADQSQIELRVGFSLAGEEVMIQAFKNGLDLHTVTASKVYNIPLDKVGKTERKAGKVLNFSIFYGKTAVGLAKDLGVSVDEAQAILDGFFAALPNLVAYMDEQKRIVHETGFVVSPMGRVIQVAEVFSENKGLRSYGDRVLINLPIQGTASDLVVDSVNQSYQAMKERKLNSVFLGQVHDSVEIDVYPGELYRIVKTIKYFSETYLQDKYLWLKCPLRMDFSFGTSWGGAIDFSVDDRSFSNGGNLLIVEGECLERDYSEFLEVARRAYDVKTEVVSSEEVEDSEFKVDTFIRDSKKITFKAEIKAL